MNPESPSTESLIGTVLEGAYRIDALLGAGGMGAVYRAMHLRLDKRVAVKVMARELAANPEALARFRREAVVTGGLGHPHIVQVFDFSTTPTGQTFLVMELLEGEDLDRRLRRVGRLPLAAVVHVVKQVASALAATHEQAIVHRDLKPGNVFLLRVAGETDFVKVLDFGISKVLAATTKITKTSSVMGTPNYMSPEQAEGKVDEIDERTDQWALACIAWECLSGTCLYGGDNVPTILYQIVHKPPPSLVQKVAGLHPEVEDVLLHALAKNKKDRFGSVNDFAMALESAAAGSMSVAASSVPVTMQLPSTSSPKPTTFTTTAGELGNDDVEVPSSRPRWRLALAACAALVLLLGGLLLFRPRTAPKPVAASPSPAVVENPLPVAPPAKAPVEPAPPLPAAEQPAANRAAPEPVVAKSSIPVASPLPPKGKHRATAKASPLDPTERKTPSRGTKGQYGNVARPSGPLNDDL